MPQNTEGVGWNVEFELWIMIRIVGL